MPVYKFSNEVQKVQTKKLDSMEEMHKEYLLSKDKLPDDNYETPLLLEKFEDKSVQEEIVGTKHHEFIEKTQDIPLKDKLALDDERALSSLSSSVDNTVQEPEAINADGTSSPYEVIDGTTFYFEDKPSVQPSFVTESVQVTALPNKQVPGANFQTDSQNSGDKKTPVNSDVLQSDIEHIDNKVETELLTDIHKDIGAKVISDSLEVIIDTAVDAIGKDDGTLLFDESDKSEDEPPIDLLHETMWMDSNVEENTEVNGREKDVENTENEGILASLARKLNILSNSREAATAESTSSQTGTSDTSTSETTATITTMSNLQLQIQTLENIQVKDVVTDKKIPETQTLHSSIDSSVMNKNDKEMEQEIIHKSTENLEISDKMQTKEKTSANRLETVTSPSDVPSSSNFVHKNPNKPASDLPTISLIILNDSTTFVEVDINSHVKEIKMQETKEETITQNIETEGIIASVEEKSTILSNEQNLKNSTTTAPNSNEIEQKLSESNEKDRQGDYKETIVEADEIAAAYKISGTSSLSIKETESITEEVTSDSHINGGGIENTVSIDETLNHSTANIQFNEELIVHSNVNKNDNLVKDISSANVPIESNENDVKSNIPDSEQFIDSSKKNEISKQTLTSNEFSHDRNFVHFENSEHRNSKY